ncbi:potassium transporter TrkA [Candidatus Sulfurimonas marisnigri]|uniref:Potassium transporter TrkA n=1 Tax=Candidatus Sulfurimonas marisnigri TaxID=2740405 RepID=A0A7S7M282_9BACT|nr:TrkA C-terminal domain-containing protein [Candidatus Sulfurimonas marisnigri]QOY55787.1 potassium transporter TrkA [Candidatus Sulfurimonas marisnigri]
MKKILIISDGDIGDHFIHRTIDTYSSENIYYVVQRKAKEYKGANPKRFKFYEFDSTSLYKLSNLLKMDFIQVVITMENLLDVENTIKNIRTIKKQLRVIVLSRWNLINKDPNVLLINSNEILASRLLDYLPNVPVIAQNVGMGEGEIMEVLVPFGSSFVYRHIGVIEQKNWRIVAIYRNRELVMPNRRRMIQPNDLLLLVGDPTVLKSVYRAIKRELGQFPEPFGSNLYIYIDMNIVNLETIENFVKMAVFTYKKLNHKLFIKIVNPNNISIIWKIKEYMDDDIMVDIDYNSLNLKESFFSDIKTHHIGLVIVSREMFKNYHMRQTLYEAHVPVLKIADKTFSSVKDAVIILSDNRDIEKISSTIFDISEQMNFNIELYNYTNEHQDAKEQVIEHYYNLSTIFSKNIKVIKESENPIKILKQKDDFIQLLPFTRKLTKRRIYSLLSTDSEKLYHKLDDYHQIFIPVQI